MPANRNGTTDVVPFLIQQVFLNRRFGFRGFFRGAGRLGGGLGLVCHRRRGDDFKAPVAKFVLVALVLACQHVAGGGHKELETAGHLQVQQSVGSLLRVKSGHSHRIGNFSLHYGVHFDAKPDALQPGANLKPSNRPAPPRPSVYKKMVRGQTSALRQCRTREDH